MKKELICIVCPKGCHLTAEEAESGWNISGFGCPRGKQYGIAEMTNPTRVVTPPSGFGAASIPACR